MSNWGNQKKHNLGICILMKLTLADWIKVKAEFKQVAICCRLFRTNWLNLQFYSQWGEPCLTTHFLPYGQIQRIGLRYFSESLFSFGNDSLGGSKKQLCLAQDCPKCPFSYFIIGNGRARESNCKQNVDSSWHAFDSSRKGALSILLRPWFIS